MSAIGKVRRQPDDGHVECSAILTGMHHSLVQLAQIELDDFGGVRVSCPERVSALSAPSMIHW